MKNLSKYLSQYAEPEAELVDKLSELKTYQHVVVVPVYKENASFCRSFLQSPLADQNVFLIVVINQPETDKDTQPQQALHDEILTLGHCKYHDESMTWIEFYHGNSACLLVNRFTKPIKEKFGVGLARKIGADLACQLIAQGKVTTQWIHSTDGDATLPENYFSSLTDTLKTRVLENHALENKSDNKKVVAACYNFSHQCSDKAVNEANFIYEQSLRYYVAGLRYANSPYSFFTIGSVIAFNVEAYANVRGFPKKSAGEDFYLLNKLAKLGDILWLPSCVLTLLARTSDRVPFGTGPAVSKIMALTEQDKTFNYYHPQIFINLKTLLQGFEGLCEHRHQLDQWQIYSDQTLKNALESLGFEVFIEKQKNTTDKQFIKQLPVWFDAFKTLKFIHFMRDNYYDDIALDKAISLAEFELI